MRQVNFPVYSYDELNDKAKIKAAEEIRDKLNGPWWDSSNVDEMKAEITYGLAEALKSPGWDTFGRGGFPGIDGVTVTGYDLERGQSIDVEGTLTPANAPRLPWVEGMVSVALNDPDCGPLFVEWEDGHEDGVETAASYAAETAMKEAIRNAMQLAWRMGRDEMDYIEGTEYAVEWIEGNNPEFHADGRFYGAGQ